MVTSVFLYPRDGEHNVVEIEHYLKRQPDVVLDPLGTGSYMVCGIPRAKKVIREARLADPSRFPYVVLVTVKPEVVNVFQEYGDEHELRSAREIVRWIIEHAPCRIEDDYGTDWTERVAQHGVGVLYPEQLT